MKQNNDYDEITFALFYDEELDHDEERAFLEALESDQVLRERYEAWTELGTHLAKHFESKELSYSLDHLSDKVMSNLPTDPSWSSSQSVQEVVEEESSTPWWRSWLTPMMVGAIGAAVILIVVQSLTQIKVSSTRSTVLINYPEQGDQAQESPVIWLIDEEENEEDESFDPTSTPDEDDI